MENLSTNSLFLQNYFARLENAGLAEVFTNWKSNWYSQSDPLLWILCRSLYFYRFLLPFLPQFFSNLITRKLLMNLIEIMWKRHIYILQSSQNSLISGVNNGTFTKKHQKQNSWVFSSSEKRIIRLIELSELFAHPPNEFRLDPMHLQTWLLSSVMICPETAL